MCYHVSQYQLSVDDEDFLATWLKTKWNEKEERLKQFYQQKKFSGPMLQDKQLSVTVMMVLATLLWGAVLFGYLACLLAFPWLWVHVAVMSALHLCVDQLLGGWDSLALYRQKKKEHVK